MAADDTRSLKRLAVRPFAIVVLAVLALNAAGWIVDRSPLEQDYESWGYAFAGFVLAMYAVPVLIVTGVCALLTFTVEDPRELALCSWIGSIASAVAGAVLCSLAVRDLGGSPAGTVFGLVALGVALALWSPVATCVLRRCQPVALS